MQILVSVTSPLLPIPCMTLLASNILLLAETIKPTKGMIFASKIFSFRPQMSLILLYEGVSAAEARRYEEIISNMCSVAEYKQKPAQQV